MPRPTICGSSRSPRRHSPSPRQILKPGGAFVAKVFQGGAEGALLAQLKRAFAELRHAKPPASRAQSAETYVSCEGVSRPPVGSAPASTPGYAVMRIEGRRPVALDDAAPDEIDQMRKDRASGGAAQPRLQPDIEPLDDRIDPPDAGAQAVEDAGFALAPMGDEGADVILRLGDRRSVRRPIDRVRPRRAACRARPYRPPCRRRAGR